MKRRKEIRIRNIRSDNAVDSCLNSYRHLLLILFENYQELLMQTRHYTEESSREKAEQS